MPCWSSGDPSNPIHSESKSSWLSFSQRPDQTRPSSLPWPDYQKYKCRIRSVYFVLFWQWTRGNQLKNNFRFWRQLQLITKSWYFADIKHYNCIFWPRKHFLENTLAYEMRWLSLLCHRWYSRVVILMSLSLCLSWVFGQCWGNLK